MRAIPGSIDLMPDQYLAAGIDPALFWWVRPARRPRGASMAIIVIDLRTVNPAAVILSGGAAMFIDAQTGAGDRARNGIAKAPVRAAGSHRPALPGAPAARSVAS